MDIHISYKEWDPTKHFLVSILTYLKRIFYVKDYKDMPDEDKQLLPNQEALELFLSDRDAYKRRVDHCVTESQKSVFLNDPGCTLNLTEEEDCHKVLRDMMKEKFNVNNSGTPGGEENDITKIVTREDTLDIIQQIEEQQGKS